jgi:hypothetical protein
MRSVAVGLGSRERQFLSTMCHSRRWACVHTMNLKYGVDILSDNQFVTSGTP